MFPETLFGIASALSGPLLTTNEEPQWQNILMRLPHVLLWTWLNTLVFDISNQCLPESVTEDRLNKAWRPLPAGRMTSQEARRLLFVTLPVSLLIIHLGLGSTEETVLLFCLTWMYNELGGSDESFIVRNIIIAVAYMLYGRGALRVACNDPQWTINAAAGVWNAMIGGLILTTMSVQDLKDQKGDHARGRSTAPLVIGEVATRVFLCIAIIF